MVLSQWDWALTQTQTPSHGCPPSHLPCPVSSSGQPSPLQPTHPLPTTPLPTIVPGYGQSSGHHLSPDCGNPAKISEENPRPGVHRNEELLLKAWGVEAPQPCCQGSRKPSRRAPVSDMLWVKCFSTLVAVLASKYPQHVPNFMAYQKAIVRASRNFEDYSWVVYDRCYRHQAAATKTLCGPFPNQDYTMKHSPAGQRQSLAANIALAKITHLATVPIAP